MKSLCCIVLFSLTTVATFGQAPGHNLCGDNLYTDATCTGTTYQNIGTDWANERNSVVLIMAPNIDPSTGEYLHNPDGSYIYGPQCSGTLIANTCGYNIPYVLTANHCTELRHVKPDSPEGHIADIALWKFIFKTERACGGGSSSNSWTVTGADLISRGSGSDYMLLKLRGTPDLPIFFAGWNAGALPTNTNTVTLHHPNGDYMKASKFSSINPVHQPYHGALTWYISSAQSPFSGTMEGGSSGAPAFDSNHRIIGQLYGSGDGATCGTSHYFGAFDITYNEIKQYLNPYNQSITSVDGYSMDNAFPYVPPLQPTISGPSDVCVFGSATYTVPGVPASSVAWSVILGNITINPTTGVVVPTSTLAGTAKIAADVATGTGCGTLRVVKSINLVISVTSTFSISGPSQLCPGQTATYSVQTGSGPYAWTSSSSGVSIDPTTGVATAGNLAKGSVTITCKRTATCEVATKIVTVVATTPSCVSVSQLSQGIRLAAAPVSGASQYRWRAGSITATPITGATTANYTVPYTSICGSGGGGPYFNGYLTYYVEALNTGICAGWSLPCRVTFRYNCSTQTLSDVSCGSLDPGSARLSMENTEFEPLQETSGFALYPNPTHSTLNITLDADHLLPASVVLYDALGRVVGTQSISSQTSNVSVEDFKAGLYWLVLIDRGGRRETRSVRIE